MKQELVSGELGLAPGDTGEVGVDGELDGIEDGDEGEAGEGVAVHGMNGGMAEQFTAISSVAHLGKISAASHPHEEIDWRDTSHVVALTR